ncbi:MAG TPA: TIGR02281 family clan AA aspartic protease [Caulobacteraceae bacterium]
MSDSEGPWGRAQAEARAQAQAHAQAQAQAHPPAPTGRPIGLYIWLGLMVAAGLGFWAMAAFMPARLGANAWGGALRDFGFLALVSSGLVRVREVKPAIIARNVAIWVGLVGVLALGYAYRGELSDAGQRLRAELLPDHAISTGAHEMVVAQDSDGQYSITGAVNGTPVRFIIDTGASDVVLSPDDARRMGLDLDSLKFSHPYSTANGVGSGADYKAQTVRAGAVQFSNLDVSINRAPMGASLLGMTFLKRLDSFEVKDGKMTLRWRG